MAQETNPEREPLTSVSPPPFEITVRTMASDVASIAASGGGPPKPHPIKILSRTAQEVGGVGGFIKTAEAPPKPEKKSILSFFSNPVFLYSLSGVFLISVFLGGYFFLYPLLNPSPAEKGGAANANPPPALTEHKTFFNKVLDGTFASEITSPISGLEMKRDEINSFVSAVSGSFFEITPENGERKPISAADFFTLINGNIINAEFLQNNFESDFTFYLYRKDGGLFPGYILRLNENKLKILTESSVQSRIESASSTWTNLFFDYPGDANGQFRSELLSGQPIRILNFTNASSVLAYGWFGNNRYLIISTSLEGLKQAISRF